jgi:hypothetical protein
MFAPIGRKFPRPILLFGARGASFGVAGSGQTKTPDVAAPALFGENRDYRTNRKPRKEY